jgi:hypothetical protein
MASWVEDVSAEGRDAAAKRQSGKAAINTTEGLVRLVVLTEGVGVWEQVKL